MSDYYCDNPLEDYVPSSVECAPVFLSGISDVVMFLEDLPSNPSDAAEVQALINLRKAVYIPRIQAMINAPEPVEVSRKIACTPATVSTYNRTISLMDDDVTPQNVQAYNSLNASSGRIITGLLLHECDANRATFIDANMNLIGGRQTDENDDGELQHFAFEIRYKNRFDAEITDWPSGLTGPV